MILPVRIIDNVNDLLGDDLKSEITPGSKVRIAASTFSIFAFEALREELEQVERAGVHLHRPSFVTARGDRQAAARSAGSSSSRRRERESSLYGSEFEIRLRNKLTQRAIARECADWMRRKVDVPVERDRRPDAAVRRSWTTGRPTCRCTASRPSISGYERGNAVSNIVNKIDEAPMTVAVPAALRPDLERPRAARGRHRGRLRPHRQRLRGELARRASTS